jgi:transposase
MHRELFRWFEIPEVDKMMRPRTRVPLMPAIGMCAAVPMHEIMKWLKIYREHGAAYTWWNKPVNTSMRAVNPLAGKKERRQLDHAHVYRLLDAGKSKKEISQLLGFPPENIDYVERKWKAGLSLDTAQQKPRIDAVALVQDYANGTSARDLADQYNTSQAYVYKLIRNHRCQDQNQL